jgi:ribonuclease T2
MRSLAIAVALVACRGEPDAQVSGAVTPPPQNAPGFGLYVLALTWAPSFCCSHPNKDECAHLADAFGATHLTLHGLWPNYTDDEAERYRATYPQFCGAYEHCKQHDKTCEPDPATIPADMRQLGPGYVGDHEFLADHEWPKHGSCTGLPPAEYFRAALDAMKAIRGDGTPDALRGAIGSDIALGDLATSFGVPRESVLLSCDAQCRLQQISFCLGHDATNHPTTPIACPANTTKARYDNGCVTRRCERVAIPAAGSCEAGERPKKSRSCSHPGQGPACTGDAECVSAGFVRCARSGCCTSQP